jgi:rhodanese-related sulfurtransferase
MMNTIKNLLGITPAPDWKKLKAHGVQIIDVRTPAEYAGGHIRGSVNIPLDTLTKNLSKIKKDKPVITCCASGMRSAAAKKTLETYGYQEVYNGGGWSMLNSKL